MILVASNYKCLSARSFYTKILLKALLFYSTDLLAKTGLIPFQLHYTLYVLDYGIKGSAEHTLLPADNGSWIVKIQANILLYNIKENSLFYIDKEDAIYPVRYEQQAGALKINHTKTTEFDWKRKVATCYRGHKKKIHPISIEPGDLDNLSYQLQLQRNFAKNETNKKYRIIRDGNRVAYLVIIDGREQLETGVGVIDTIRVKTIKLKFESMYKPYANKKVSLWVWMAPNWDYIPVQYSKTENNHTFTAVLKQGKVGDRNVKGFTD